MYLASLLKKNSVFFFITAALAFAKTVPAKQPKNAASPIPFAKTRREFKPDVVPFGTMLIARVSPSNVEQRVCQGGWHLIINGDPSVPGFVELGQFFPTLAYGYKGRIDNLLVDTSTPNGQKLFQGQFKQTRPSRVLLELYKSEPPAANPVNDHPPKDLVYLSSRDWFTRDELVSLRKDKPKLAELCERGDFTLETLKEWLKLRTGKAWDKPALTSLDNETAFQVLRSDAMHLVIFWNGKIPKEKRDPQEVSDLDELASMADLEAAVSNVMADIHDGSHGESFFQTLRHNQLLEDWDGKLVMVLFRGHPSDPTRTERWATYKLKPDNVRAQVKTYVADCLGLPSLDSQPWVVHKPAPGAEKKEAAANKKP